MPTLAFQSSRSSYSDGKQAPGRWRRDVCALKNGLGHIQLHNLISDTPVGQVQNQSKRPGLFACDVSPDGSLIAVGGEDYTVKLYDAKLLSLTATLIGHSSSITCLRWEKNHQSNARLVSAAQDGSIIVWRKC